MSHFVSDSRAEFRGRQRDHQRKTNQQIVAWPTEQSESRYRHNTSIKIFGKDNRIYIRSTNSSLDLIDHFEQKRVVRFSQFQAKRRSQTHPQRAQDGSRHNDERNLELDDEAAETYSRQDAPKEQQNECQEQRQYQKDIGVTEQCQQ